MIDLTEIRKRYHYKNVYHLLIATVFCSFYDDGFKENKHRKSADMNILSL